MATERIVRFSPVVIWSVLVVCLLYVGGCTQSAEPEQGIYTALRESSGDADYEIQPDRAPTARTLFSMADILDAQGKHRESEMVLKRIIVEYPEFFPVYNTLAELLMRQGRTNEAVETIGRGLDINPRDSVLLNNLGMCRVIRRDYEKALELFTKSAGIMPENARYRANMAMTLALLGRYDESLALYKQVLPKDKAEHNISILKKSRTKTPGSISDPVNY